MNKFLKIIKSCILCIRFPFLYPRNRFTDRHYTNWKLEYILTFLRNVRYDEIWTNVITQKEYDELTPKTKQTNLKSNNINYFVSIDYYCKQKDKNCYYIGNRQGVKFPINNNLFSNGTLIKVEIVNNKVLIVASDDFKLKEEYEYLKMGFKPLQINENKIITYNIKLIEFFYNFIAIFHCIPSHTELDAMPDGWRKAFGIQMCKEIRKGLIKSGWKCLFKYRIMQIKEKFGTLRWYDAYEPEDSGIFEITQKYENLSERICINCGKPARWISMGWISPYCDDCVGDTTRCKKINE